MLLWFSMMTLQAQEISVLSFNKLEKDLDARVHYRMQDRDGELCAIIKVVTPETGFEFDGGSLGLIKVERKTGEYWVYVPRGAAAITIKHDRLGVLRDYAYPLPIEKATVYEMKLVTGRLRVEVEPIELQSEYLVITTEPGDALIYIDDVYEAKGLLQKKLLPGSYTYRVEAPLYHTEAGQITMTSGKKEERQIKLRSNHGFIEVISTPETGAKVLIDDTDAGFQTNGISSRLRSGEYTVTVIREQYQPASQRVTVRDGETTRVSLAMSPNFAIIEVKIPAQASLYIDNLKHGEGSWKGRLGSGVYILEARQPRHRSARRDVQVVIGQDQTISLTPEPIYGSLDITSVPARASIKLEGKEQGTTPMIIRNLLVGEYTLSLSAPGHGTYTERMEVKEGPPISVHAVLPSGMEVSIESDPPGARVEIDGKEAGITPLKVLMAYGSHNLKITNKSKVVSETVTVSEGGKATYLFDVRETRDFTEQDRNLEFDLIKRSYASIDAEDFKFDVVDAKIIPKSNYVLRGDNYEAEVLVAAYDSKSNPDVMLLVGADTLTEANRGQARPVEGAQGVVKISIPATSLGLQRFAGIINVQNPLGGTIPYPFKGEYIVGEPSLTVSAKKMNVFYIGVDNPVSISVPGIPTERLRPSISAGRLTSAAGEWNVRVDPGTTKTTISVSADIDGGMRSMGSADFRVKRVPDPVAQIAGRSSGLIGKSALSSADGIILKMPDDFEFELYFEIVSFSFVIVRGGDVFERTGRGNRFTPEMQALIDGAQRRAKIWIENIIAKGPDGNRQLGTISLQIQ